MRFADGALLWGLVGVPLLLLALLAAERRRERDLARWLAPSVWQRLGAELFRGRRRASAAFLVLAAVLLLIGAARPQLGSRVLETRQRGSDVVIAVDVSLSMEARDVAPSRRERAKQEIVALVEQLRGDRIALLSFAGEAFLQCPLTLDRGAIRLLLPLLDPAVMPEPGTNLAEAIHRAIGAFQDDPRRGRAIILLTDGEAHDRDLEQAIAEAKEARARICAIGIGKPAGDPIPMPARPGSAGGGYKKDRTGSVVITRLVEEPLRRACDATGGTYVRADAGMASGRIVRSLRDLEQGEMEGGLGIRYEERYAYFAGLALVLLLAEGALGFMKRER